MLGIVRYSVRIATWANTGLLGCRFALQQNCSTVRLLRCRATGLYLQGLLAARLQRSRARACGANNTPAHAKEREVNANVNSIILKSLPKFGKLFRIIEFTFAFTSLSFACAGVLFAPHVQALLSRSLPASSPCRYSTVAQQACSRTVLQFCCNADRQPNNPVLAQVAIRTLHRTTPSNSQVQHRWHFARHKTTRNILISVFLVACDSRREHRKPGWRHMIVERRCSKLGFKKIPSNGIHIWKK